MGKAKRRIFFIHQRIQSWAMLSLTLLCVSTILVFGVVPDVTYRAALAPWFSTAGLRAVCMNEIYPQLDILFLVGMPLFVLLSLVLALLLTHRIVGPLYHVRRVVREYRAGNREARVRLRAGDFCDELADDVNALLDDCERLAGR